MVVRNAVSAEQLTECLGAEKVTLELILKVELPVKADRARYVGLAVAYSDMGSLLHRHKFLSGLGCFLLGV